MLRTDKILFSVVFILCLLCCKPYNSNEANKKLIQGKWMLVDVDHNILDSVRVDYYKQVTYLIFKENKCIQQLIDINEDSEYTFTIEDFNLNLYSDSVLSNRLSINKLTSDSLILSLGDDKYWRYKKIRQ